MATDIFDWASLGSGWNYGNALMSNSSTLAARSDFGESAISNDVTYPAIQKTFDIIANKGFKHVRIPIGFDNYDAYVSSSSVAADRRSAKSALPAGTAYYTVIPTSGDFTISSNFLNRVKSLCNMVIKAGMIPVIDYHNYFIKDSAYNDLAAQYKNRAGTFQWLQMNSYCLAEGNINRFESHWRQVATHLRDVDNVVFELINEPLDKNYLSFNSGQDPVVGNETQFAALRTFQKKAYDAIRAVSPNRPVIFASYGAAPKTTNYNDSFTRYPELKTDKNTALAFHFYQPNSICYVSGSGSSPATDFSFERDIQNIWNSTMSPFITYAKDNGINLIMTEAGAEDRSNINAMAGWAAWMRATFYNYYKIPIAMWDSYHFKENAKLVMTNDAYGVLHRDKITSNMQASDDTVWVNLNYVKNWTGQQQN